MTAFNNWLAQFNLDQPSLAIIGTGLVLVALILLGGRQWRAIRRIRRAQQSRRIAKIIPDSENERRNNLRRADLQTEVHVADAKKTGKSLGAFVIDRSVNGLRLAMKSAYPSGASLKIRAVNAPAETPWTVIRVRNCEALGDYYEVGCQFEGKVPWNILLMFG